MSTLEDVISLFNTNRDGFMNVEQFSWDNAVCAGLLSLIDLLCLLCCACLPTHASVSQKGDTVPLVKRRSGDRKNLGVYVDKHVAKDGHVLTVPLRHVTEGFDCNTYDQQYEAALRSGEYQFPLMFDDTNLAVMVPGDLDSRRHVRFFVDNMDHKTPDLISTRDIPTVPFDVMCYHVIRHACCLKTGLNVQCFIRMNQVINGVGEVRIEALHDIAATPKRPVELFMNFGVCNQELLDVFPWLRCDDCARRDKLVHQVKHTKRKRKIRKK